MSFIFSTFAQNLKQKDEHMTTCLMKRIFIYLVIAVILTACHQEKLENRAVALWAYIPDVQLLEKSRAYMTEDFYALLDTLFHHLPSHEAMDHEYNYWFVTDDGSPLANCPCEVQCVYLTDDSHAEAIFCGNHQLSMERVHNQWLMSDFDGRKLDGIRYIATNRKEQAVRDAISDYLLREVAPLYKQGDICIPTLMMVHETDSCIWGDFLVLWYIISGDTLKTVSGGIHPGLMSLIYENGNPKVTHFEQVEDGSKFMSSAKQIFGKHLDIFMNMHANAPVREAVRREQSREYVERYGLPVHYYQDYGWEAVKLCEE